MKKLIFLFVMVAGISLTAVHAQDAKSAPKAATCCKAGDKAACCKKDGDKAACCKKEAAKAKK